MNYAQIRSMDISNGEGIGVSIFVQGCHFHCKNCFNSETWDFNGGKQWNIVTKNNFLKLLNKPYIKRVSILGGEPLCDENVNDVYELIEDIQIRFPKLDIWLYTGYKWEVLTADTEDSSIEDALRKMCSCSATVVVDDVYVDELKNPSCKWCGSVNQRVIDVSKTLSEGKVVTYEDNRER